MRPGPRVSGERTEAERARCTPMLGDRYEGEDQNSHQQAHQDVEYRRGHICLHVTRCELGIHRLSNIGQDPTLLLSLDPKLPGTQPSLYRRMQFGRNRWKPNVGQSLLKGNTEPVQRSD